MGNLSTEIQRDGTSQIKRLAEALLPGYVKVDERSTEDYLELLYKLAEQFIYKNEKNIPSGNWQEFFADFAQKDNINAVLEGLKKTKKATPHITLVIVFLKFLEIAIGDLNQLTKKHLDFFYNKVLRIERNKAEADRVHVVFELEKNTKAYKLDEGTLLDAGKDANKNLKKYKLEKEIILNQTKIKSLRSVFVEKSQNHRIFCAPVANSSDGLGTPFETENNAWNAFGESQLNNSDTELTMQEADMGFAVASPLFYLSEGERTISLQISGRSLLSETNNLQNDFKVYITGEKEWLLCEWITGILTTNPATIDPTVPFHESNLVMQIKLPTGAPATFKFNNDVHKDGFQSEWPVLKVVLNHDATQYSYRLLKALEINNINIEVHVTGLKTVSLQNENGQLDPKKPFLPFGALPRRFSTLTISSKELAAKNIDNLSVSLLWDNLPEASLGSYYGDYSVETDQSDQIDNESFRVLPSVYQDGEWSPLSSGAQTLFDGVDATKMKSIVINTGLSMPLTDLIDSNKSLNNGVKLELQPLVHTPTGQQIDTVRAFGHQEFTNLYTNVAMKKAKPDLTEAEIDALTFPNPPYTPIIKELNIEYVSSSTVSLDELQPTGQYFKIEPFGHVEVSAPSGYYNLLSTFDDEGNFYIGLKDFNPPQNVSILFRVAEGSGIVSPESEVENIRWSYLTKSGWKELSSLEILTQTTLNLQKTGLIEFSIGRDAVKGDSRFIDSPELHWVRGSVVEESRQICKLLELWTNATQAKYVTEGIDDPQIVTLEAGKISKLVNKKAAVKKIIQPYPSFGGRSAESDQPYYTRVSERIRHKNRQTTLWDYERAILQQFPEVYKVKCLKHADAVSDIAPGSVTLLIISNLRNQNAANPLEPTTSYGTLVEIGNYVSNFVSPFANINVENPVYEKLFVDFKVGFYEGIDGGFYADVLNEEIKKFLSPWAYDEGQDIIFGGKVYRSDILWYIENREYVDYVTEFKLYHIYDSPSNTGIDCMQIENDFIVRDYQGLEIGDMAIGSTFIVGYESEIAAATSPRSILVSAEDHRIEVLNPGEYSCVGNEYNGIGQMAIEINFDIV